MSAVRLLVIAKAPVPGRSKTRLCPPCTAEEAALLAEAALVDTLEAGAAAGFRSRALVLEGEPGGWLRDGYEVIPQRGEGLGERVAAAFEDAGAPAIAIGMDTPQVTPALLEGAAASLEEPGAGAVLGPTLDGGYWAIGLRRADRAVFEGVPMSTSTTAATQLKRLRELGLRCRQLPVLRDVDTMADAQALAAECPGSRFAARVARLRTGGR